MNLMHNEYKESLKVKSDYDNLRLLNIQKIIDENVCSGSNVKKIISKLSDIERKKLILLYEKNIYELNNTINNYKCKILKERIRNN